MAVFYQVMLPVLLIFLSGFMVQKWQQLNLRSLSTVAIYILSPCLVFRTFYQTEINLQYAYMVLFALLLLFGLIALNKLYSRWRHYSPSVESGLILSTAFMNSGNYGVPVILFAYGEAGFHYAVSFMVLQSILMSFFGVYYAARGQAGVAVAVRQVFKMPATYAAGMAILLQALNIRIPDNFYGAIDLVAEATIPVVMIILGMQLADIQLHNIRWEKIGFGVVTRMFISPLLAVLLLFWMPIDPLFKKVLIVSVAMPSAATTAMYAVQFEAEPELVSGITLITTLVSVVTISLLLIILG
jgi:hypothetical protein